MQVPQEVSQQMEAFAQKRGADIGAVQEAVEDELEGIPENFEEQRRWNFALKRAKQSYVAEDSLGGGGDQATIITIGHGRVSRWQDKQHDDYQEGMNPDNAPRKDVLIANGVARNESDGSASLATILLDSTNGINLGRAMDLFQEPLNVIEGNFNFSDPQVSSEGQVLFSVAGTELTEAENPPEMAQRKKWVHRFVDEVDIASIASAPKATLSLSDSNGAADFGLDIKRIPEAYVVDYYINNEDDWGVYTVLDDSIVDESELDDTQLVGDNQQVSGLSCWSQPNLMEYDERSICDVYGVVQEGNDGQISMDLRGIDPIVPEMLNEGSADNQTGESF